MIVGSNWKLQLENGLDGYHGGFTHRSFFSLMQRRTGSSVRYASGLPTAQTKAFRNGHAAVDPETTSKQPLRGAAAATTAEPVRKRRRESLNSAITLPPDRCDTSR